MQHDIAVKKYNFDLSTPWSGWGLGKGRGHFIYYHVAAFLIPLNVMQHDIVLKKVEFDLLTPRVGGEVGGRGSAAEIFATM